MMAAAKPRIGLSRRALIKGSLVVGAGLVVGFELPVQRRQAIAQQTPGHFTPNQWIKIDRDGLVTIVNSVVEMGQGSLTTMPMIVADELDADFDKVRVDQAPANPKLYANPQTGNQSYGGSRGVRDHMQMLRKAGAAAREMLMQAAVSEWNVPVGELETEPGVVVHKSTGRRLPYGQLVDKAAQLPVPQNPKLKTPDQFRYIGKIIQRRDTPIKVNGVAIYGVDVQVPGMLIASIERCPVFGGSPKTFDAAAAKRIPGVKHIVQVTNGIAVVADSFWTAQGGRKALKATWNEGSLATLTSAQIRQGYEQAAKQPGQQARKEGEAEKALAAGGNVIEAIYEVPFLEHACMEPMNATAHVRSDSCEIWAPTQNPGGSQQTGARITGLPVEKVIVNTTFLGGGFGRRGEQDFIIDAVETSKAVGAPVKVMWTREDDIQHGFYRPATYNVFKASLDDKGMPVAWWNRLVGPGLQVQKGRVPAYSLDATAMAGARDMPYNVPNILVEWVNKDYGIPVGFWRSVGSSQNAFIVESFVDELAHAARQDPFEYRRGLLGKSPRHRAVLELAASGQDACALAGRLLAMIRRQPEVGLRADKERPRIADVGHVEHGRHETEDRRRRPLRWGRRVEGPEDLRPGVALEARVALHARGHDVHHAASGGLGDPATTVPIEQRDDRDAVRGRAHRMAVLHPRPRADRFSEADRQTCWLLALRFQRDGSSSARATAS